MRVARRAPAVTYFRHYAVMKLCNMQAEPRRRRALRRCTCRRVELLEVAFYVGVRGLLAFLDREARWVLDSFDWSVQSQSRQRDLLSVMSFTSARNFGVAQILLSGIILWLPRSPVPVPAAGRNLKNSRTTSTVTRRCSSAENTSLIAHLTSSCRIVGRPP